MLEARARLTATFLDSARRQHAGHGAEPKLSLAVGAYAREHRIVAVPVAGDVIDLGAREAAASSVPHNSAAGYSSRQGRAAGSSGLPAPAQWLRAAGARACRAGETAGSGASLAS